MTMNRLRRFISSIRFRLLAIVLLGAVLPLALTGWWSTRSAVRASEAELMARLQDAVDEMHADMLGNWYRRRSELLDLGEASLLVFSVSDQRLVDAVQPWVRTVTVLDTDGAAVFSAESNAGPNVNRGPSLTVAARVPIIDPRSGSAAGSVEADMPLSSLVDPSVTLATTPRAVLGVMDQRTGVSYLTLPFTDNYLAEDAFTIAGEEWRTRRRLFEDLGLMIVAAAPVSSILAPIRNAAQDGLEILAVVTILILLLVSGLVRPLIASVKALTTAAEKVAQGDLSQVAPAAGEDELARLGRAFNHMTSTLKDTLRKLSEREGLAAVGEFAASLSHDVRNALTSIRVDLQVLGERLPEDADLRRIQGRALRRSTRLNQTVTTALTLARSGQIERVDLDLQTPLGQAVEAVAHAAAEVDCSVGLHLPEKHAIRISGDATALERLFSNLLLNAVQASSQGSSVAVDVCIEGEWVQIDVIDQGAGIPEEILETVFQPLVSGRQGGTGMGLAIADRIARSHGGHLELLRSGSEGTAIRVRLPIG